MLVRDWRQWYSLIGSQNQSAISVQFSLVVEKAHNPWCRINMIYCNINPGTSGGDAFEWSNATSINMARYTPTLGVSIEFLRLGVNWYTDLHNKQFPKKVLIVGIDN